MQNVTVWHWIIVAVMIGLIAVTAWGLYRLGSILDRVGRRLLRKRNSERADSG